jgi:hypothetical protein
VHLILQPRALPHDMCPAQHLPPQRARRRVGHPHQRQEASRQQLGEDRSIGFAVFTFASAIARVLAGGGHHHPPGPEPNPQ